MSVRNWVNRHEIELMLGATLAAVLATLGFAMWVVHKESQEWAAFAEVNDCKVVEHRKGTSTTIAGTAVGAKGQITPAFGVASTPATTAYVCSDGVTYWR